MKAGEVFSGMRKQVIPVARYCNATRKFRVEDPKEGVTTPHVGPHT